jgi:hypothetical protein
MAENESSCRSTVWDFANRIHSPALPDEAQDRATLREEFLRNGMWTSTAVVGAADVNGYFWDNVPHLLSAAKQLRLVIVQPQVPNIVFGEHLWPEVVLLYSGYYRASVEGVLAIMHYDRVVFNAGPVNAPSALPNRCSSVCNKPRGHIGFCEGQSPASGTDEGQTDFTTKRKRATTAGKRKSQAI